MDGLDPVQVQHILELINTGGITVLLVMILAMFIRGDIIPKKVYERMLRDTLTKIASDIIASVSSLLKEQNAYSEKQLREMETRFNHIEDCIEKVRKGNI